MVAIRTIDLTQDFKRVADRIIQGERVLIPRPKNENLVIITEKEYKELDKMRENKKSLARARLKQNIEALQKSATASEVEEITMEEIDSEVQSYRHEKRGT